MLTATALNHHRLVPVKTVHSDLAGRHYKTHLSSLLPLSIHSDLISGTHNLRFHTPQSLSSSSSQSPLSTSTSSSSLPRTQFNSSTRLYVSGLSFRTTEESLRDAFKNFGELLEVKLPMDRIAKRPRGFAFVRYATEEESHKAIEGMHGKFLHGRVIFVEVAKPRLQGRERPESAPT